MPTSPAKSRNQYPSTTATPKPATRRRSTRTSTAKVLAEESDDSDSAEQYWEIKDILGEKEGNDGVVYYLVQWTGKNPKTGKPYKPSWVWTDLSFVSLIAY